MKTSPKSVMIACDKAIMALMRRAGLTDEKAHELTKVIWHELSDKMTALSFEQEQIAFDRGKKEGFARGLSARERQTAS